MPIRYEDGQTPRGAHCLRIYTWGRVELADAEELATRLTERDHRVLALAARDTDYAQEARKFLPVLKRRYKAVAVVAGSPIVRAAINLMIRFTGDVGELKMFPNEDEALVWLDDFA